MNENIAIRAIASQLDLCLSTVYREIERGKQTNGIYNAVVAQETVENNRRRRGRKKKQELYPDAEGQKIAEQKNDD